MVKKIWLLLVCALCHTLAAVRLQPGTFDEHNVFTSNGEVVEFNQSQVTQLQSFLINGIVSDPGIVGDSIPVPISNDTLDVLRRMFLEASSASAVPTFNAKHAQIVLNEITPEQFLPLMHALWFLDSANEQLRSIVAGRYLEVQKQISLDNLAAHFEHIEAFFLGSLAAQQQLHETLGSHLSINTLLGHTSFINSVTFSPDGTMLAIGSADGTAQLWDAHTGQCLQTLSDHTGRVNSVAFSPDGTLLATGCLDNTARIWDAYTGQCLHTLPGHTDRVSSVAFSPDGTMLATGSWDNTARLWDTHTEHCLRTLYGHTNKIDSVAFSPDGTLLATGSWDNTARLWLVKNLTESQQLFVLWVIYHPHEFHRGGSVYLDEIFNSLPDIVKPKITAPAGDGAGHA